MDIKLIVYIICKSSPNQQVVFLHYWWFPLLCRSFLFDAIAFVYFPLFYFPCLRRQIKKRIFKTMSKSILPRFPSRSFMISSLIFRSFTNVELMSVYSVSHLVFLFFTCCYHVFPTLFITETMLSPFAFFFFLLCHKLIFQCISFWALNSVPLYVLSYVSFCQHHAVLFNLAL